MKTARMTARQLQRVRRLLMMEYKPSELADELGVTSDWVYKSAVPSGCPHRRDAEGNIWIVGTEFAQWARETFKRKTFKLADGEAYCLTCKRPVVMVETSVRPVSQVIEMMVGKCSVCGTKVYRSVKRDQP